MAVKTIKVFTPGGDVCATVKVTPQMTAAEALGCVGLNSDFYLRPETGDQFFQADDKLDKYVHDGQTLYAYPWAKAGLDTIFFFIGPVLLYWAWRLTMRVFRSIRRQYHIRSGPAHRQANDFRPGFVPFWHRMGWKRSGALYRGRYLVGTRRLQGEIFFRSAWDCEFKVLTTKNLIVSCGKHRRCFIRRGRQSPAGLRWYEVHFDKRPRSISSGIIAIQQMLSRAQR